MGVLLGEYFGLQSTITLMCLMEFISDALIYLSVALALSLFDEIQRLVLRSVGSVLT